MARKPHIDYEKIILALIEHVMIHGHHTFLGDEGQPVRDLITYDAFWKNPRHDLTNAEMCKIGELRDIAHKHHFQF